MEPMNPWINLLQTFGLATMCLVVMGYAVWKVGNAVWTTVLVPIATRHMKFLDELSALVNDVRRINTENTELLRSVLGEVGNVKTMIIRTTGSISLHTQTKDPPSAN